MARFRIGCEGFGYENWRGHFYPPKLSDGRFLEFYSQVFNSVEINSSFYEIPRESTVSNWKKVVSPDFVFTAKFPQSVTHFGGLAESISLAKSFISTMTRLGPKLGALLLQFSSNFDKTRLNELLKFLNALPSDVRYAVELRNASWFEKGTLEGLLKALGEFRIALCSTDHPTVPRGLYVTTDFAYVRWQGEGRPLRSSDDLPARMQELSTWAASIRDLSKSVTRVYCFVNDVFTGHAPAGANYLKGCLGLETVEPNSVWPAFGELFTP